jgi:transposase
MRGLLGEFGVVVPLGIKRLRKELPRILEDVENGLPALARTILADLLEELRHLDDRVGHYDRELQGLADQSEAATRLMAIDGIGPITSTALVASVGNARVFKNGRQFAAWLGLTQRQHSSGGRNRLGRITKRGDRYLRTFLVHGARALLRFVDRKSDAKSAWARRLKGKRPVLAG